MQKDLKKFFYLIKYISVSLLFVILIFSIIYVQALSVIPNELLIINGEEYTCNFKLPIPIAFLSDKQASLSLNGNHINSEVIELNLKSPFTIRSSSMGKINLKLKLFGIIPLKTMVVQVVPNKNVIPCGNSIGVKIYTKGVIVIETSRVYGNDNKFYEPYKTAGIKPGDYIIKINNTAVNNIEDIIKSVEASNGNPILIKVNRDNEIISTKIIPIKSYKDNKYKIGLWVRDGTAGIGTMTFYDPVSNTFGALGHGITDVDTGSLLKINKGEILNSNIVSVKKGEKGYPGELKGIFEDNRGILGKILKNTECGIYGTILNNDTKNIFSKSKAMPIALKNQIKEGPAQIISNISGTNTNTYNIEIQKVFKNHTNSSRSMVIKITDTRLINYTGGIVQGMSGSPIIQNGKLVGAVTHVLVNDPTRGYGVFIEWMIKNISNNTAASNILKNAS